MGSGSGRSRTRWCVPQVSDVLEKERETLDVPGEGSKKSTVSSQTWRTAAEVEKPHSISRKSAPQRGSHRRPQAKTRSRRIQPHARLITARQCTGIKNHTGAEEVLPRTRLRSDGVSHSGVGGFNGPPRGRVPQTRTRRHIPDHGAHENESMATQ